MKPFAARLNGNCRPHGHSVVFGRAALAVCALLAPCSAAWAQSAIQGLEAPPPTGQTASQNPHPGYEALGQQLGGFILLPRVGLQESYNSNVFATPSDTKGDFITSLQPSVALTSNWNNDALNFAANGEIRRYAEQVGENQSNFGTTASGRLDILTNIYLTGGVGYQLLHEDRTSPDTVVNQKNPTEYQVASGRIAYVQEPTRLSFRIDAGLDSYYYNNNVTSTGTFIPETDRNRVEYGLTPRVAYEFSPGYQAFIKVPLSYIDYDTKFDAGGFQRNSRGYQIDGGLAVDLTHIMFGDVYAGYYDQKYADSRLTSPAGITFGGDLYWNVTQRDTIKASLVRAVTETTIANASSALTTTVSLSEEHELLRNVLLTANIGYSDSAFQGFDRNDNVYFGGIGARYLLNRFWSAGLNGYYSRRLSNTTGSTIGVNAGNNFSQGVIMASILLQY